jgi:septin 7
VIAKADTLTPDELMRFKRTVLREILDNNIKVYQFPDSSDADEQAELCKLKERVPFAVIGSNVVQDVEGKRVRCRRYPWGTVEVDNLDHNDFIALRNMLIRSNLIDLIDVTRGVHYENFRCRQLMAKPGAVGDDSDNTDPFTQLEHERKMSEAEIQQKTRDMDKILASKSAEREALIKQKETEAKRQEDELKERVAHKQAERNVQYQKLKALKEQYPALATDSRASLQSAGSQDRSPDSLAKKKVKSSTLSMFTRHKD